MDELLQTIILGILEGITEFLPISSTGHLFVGARLLDATELAKGPFIIAIQFGAVLALLLHHAPEFVGLFRWHSQHRLFWRALAISFAPAALVGVAIGGAIEQLSITDEKGPLIVAFALIAGGLVMLVVERRLPPPIEKEYNGLPQLSTKSALLIGICQVMAFVPGVSRAGASIVGGLLAGLDRREATRFSFFLAIPTVAGAAAYSTWLNAERIRTEDFGALLLGITVSALVAWLCIRWLLRYVSAHRFTPFAWYRLAAGGAILLFRWRGII